MRLRRLERILDGLVDDDLRTRVAQLGHGFNSLGYDRWGASLDATQRGLDVVRFKADFASAEVRTRVDADKKEAVALGITGAPAVFINGRFLYGAPAV